MRIEDIVFAHIDGIEVLDYSTDLYIGKSEGLSHVPHALGLDDGLVKDLSAEVDHRTVRLDGPRMNVDDVARFLEKGDFNVRIFASVFSQNLDAEVIVLVCRQAPVVAVHLTIENNRGRPGSLRLARHF